MCENESICQVKEHYYSDMTKTQKASQSDLDQWRSKTSLKIINLGTKQQIRIRQYECEETWTD